MNAYLKRHKSLFMSVAAVSFLIACTNDAEPQHSSQPATSDESKENESQIVLSREQEILATMSLEEKVGQLFLARMPDDNAIEYAQTYDLGGYLLFGKDFSEKSYEKIQVDIAEIQNAMPIDLFMAVDEEGGDVTRISSFLQFRETPFLSPREEFQLNGWEGIEAVAHEQAALLRDLGVNLNLAPVADVPFSSEDFIFSRSFSTQPQETAEFVERVVTIYNQENVGTVMKHFPGYGNNVDTHTGVAYDDRDSESFWDRDYLPFLSGIQAGTEGVLVAHNVIQSIDPNLPASLSPEVIGILREDLAFEGLIITDDLVMEGLQTFASPEEAAVLAVLAGNDLLISSDFLQQVPAVLAAVEEGRIAEERIDISVLRVLRIKLQLGLL